jgi:hypothetical protein
MIRSLVLLFVAQQKSAGHSGRRLRRGGAFGSRSASLSPSVADRRRSFVSGVWPSVALCSSSLVTQ